MDRATANTLPGSVCCARARELLGVRFAAYVVVDGEFATAPFLHTAGDLGLPIVARLKANLPEFVGRGRETFSFPGSQTHLP